MKNYQIEAKDGSKHWISRSVAVTAILMSDKILELIRTGKDCEKEIYFLAVKRGSGSGTFPGLWCLPCGYVDFDETVKQACVREIKEETNLDIDISILRNYIVEDSPEAFNQNITFRFTAFIPYDSKFSVGTTGEKNEIEEVKWINSLDIDKYEWAFNHNELLKKMI